MKTFALAFLLALAGLTPSLAAVPTGSAVWARHVSAASASTRLPRVRLAGDRCCCCGESH